MFNRIRAALSPFEWTLIAIVAFLMLVSTICMMDAVLACGSEGLGPAATSTC